MYSLSGLIPYLTLCSTGTKIKIGSDPGGCWLRNSKVGYKLLALLRFCFLSPFISIIDKRKIKVYKCSFFSKVHIEYSVWVLVFSSRIQNEQYKLGSWSCEFIICLVVLCWVSSVISNSFNCINGSPPGSSVHGILQARILEWVVMPSARESLQPSDQTHVSCISCIDRSVLYH